MCVIVKTRCFYSLPLVHSQDLKKSAHYSWGIYQENVATKFNKAPWWALWVGDPRNFHNSFFVKNLLELELSALLKKEKNLKKVANHLKIGWKSKRQTENIEKRERKTKNNLNFLNAAILFFTFTITLLLIFI